MRTSISTQPMGYRQFYDINFIIIIIIIIRVEDNNDDDDDDGVDPE